MSGIQDYQMESYQLDAQSAKVNFGILKEQGLEKRCKKCKKIKLLNEFHKSKASKTGSIAYCKQCIALKKNKNFTISLKQRNEYYDRK